MPHIVADVQRCDASKAKCLLLCLANLYYRVEVLWRIEKEKKEALSQRLSIVQYSLFVLLERYGNGFSFLLHFLIRHNEECAEVLCGEYNRRIIRYSQASPKALSIAVAS